MSLPFLVSSSSPAASGTLPRSALRRAVVALDASPHSLAVLAATARLAALLDLELVGVFVEDETLLRLADLPVTWEVGAKTATVRGMDSMTVARQFRAQSTQLRRILARTARQNGVSWRFHVARGRVVPELLAVVEPTDLLGMGRMGWPLSRRPRMGSTAQAMLQRSVGPVFIPGRSRPTGARGQARLAVLFDGSAPGERGVTLAVALARSIQAALTVLLFPLGPAVPAQGEERVRSLRAQARAVLDGLNTAQIPGIDFQMGVGTIERLIHVLNNREDELLILPQSYARLTDELAGAVVVVV